MSMLDPFRRFFEPEQEESGVGDADAILSFGKEAYFEKFMAYLERESDRPLDLSTTQALTSSAARSNAFKEIRTYLRNQLKSAQEIMDRRMTDV